MSLVRDAARSRSCGFLESLCRQRRQQDQDGFAAGLRWQENSPAFASKVGTPLAPSLGRREFRRAIRGAAGFAPDVWTPSKLRHTAASSLALVSRPSDSSVPLAGTSRLVRPQQHSRDGTDLPQADPAGAARRKDSHGPDIQRLKFRVLNRQVLGD